MCAVAVFDSSSLPLVEDMYAKFLADPNSVDAEWKAYFLGWQAAGSASEGREGDNSKSLAQFKYAEAWRTRGHLAAHINPLAESAPQLPEELKPETYGLTAAEAGNYQAVYGAKTGIETAHLRTPAERQWVQNWWENEAAKTKPDAAVQKLLYTGLVQAGFMEKFLHTKFVGAKRFSVEGNDGIVPLLKILTEISARDGVKNIVMGMAHRGRLNVLCNILHKPFEELFAAFADKMTLEGGPSSGDVKYHMGKVYTTHTASGDVELQLLYNPSHLEAVNASVLGVARAKADLSSDTAYTTVLPVLIHGDSAVAGQGIVAEVNNLMGVPAYHVGGTVHFVLNNQVGFTADPVDAFATAYCTDIFKHISIPIVHVNADDIEACLTATIFAWEYRKQFGKDVALDLVGYRRWGHNEGDDPTFTQPKLYEKIRPHATPAEVYAAQLKGQGMSEGELSAIEQAFTAELNAAFEKASKGITSKAKGEKASDAQVETMAEAGALKCVTENWSKQPSGFQINDKVNKVIEERIAMLHGEKPLNWGAAETAAYGALLQEGISIRITGQDIQRGTFSHRHAVLVNGADGSKWNVLQPLAANGATAQFYNSVLSENAVMGFEYGYALARPTNSLVIWEGQFGDFANGAQVVIDQFLSAAETKWGQMNHLTLLLPHGYEGQGPEHSSARL
ncbi:MAG: 2-oxoglutarate dehydrogenase E1 component, partial [Pseudomonas fluorescens]